MNQPSQLARQTRFIAIRLGWVGWIGLGTLLLAALAALLGVRVLESSNARQAGRIASLQSELVRQSDPETTQRTRDPLATLVAALPAQGTVPDFLTAIQRRAEQASVQIDRTEYRVQPILGQAAQRYRLRFPAHTDYPHLRVWLERLLHDYPSMILDEISLRRAVDGSEELEVNVALSFLARQTP